VAVPRELALSFLWREAMRSHAQFQSELHGRSRPGRRDRAVRADAVVGALSVVGLLEQGEVEAWTSRLSMRRAEPPPADGGLSAAAADVLEELLAEVPVAEDWPSVPLSRFEGAVDALTRVGAADRDVWDARLTARMGWPSEDEIDELERELNAGGTEHELIAVLAGPPDPVAGVLVLYALRFTDGISFWIHNGRDSVGREDEAALFGGNDWTQPGLELRDDLGTAYSGASYAGSDEDLYVTFGTAPPDEASWVELVVSGNHAIRVLL
jgi:hypothetical protein